MLQRINGRFSDWVGCLGFLQRGSVECRRANKKKAPKVGNLREVVLERPDESIEHCLSCDVEQSKLRTGNQAYNQSTIGHPS